MQGTMPDAHRRSIKITQSQNGKYPDRDKTPPGRCKENHIVHRWCGKPSNRGRLKQNSLNSFKTQLSTELANNN